MSELRIHKATVIQVVPLAPGWVLEGDDRPYPLAMVALVEFECSTDEGFEWTGRQILPVDDDLEIRGIPTHDGFYLAHAFGDERHGFLIRRASADEEARLER